MTRKTPGKLTLHTEAQSSAADAHCGPHERATAVGHGDGAASVETVLDETTPAPSASSYEPSLVSEWNELALSAVRDSGASPTPTTWRLHVLHAAIYDAWTAYDADSFGLYVNLERPAAEATEANQAEAISYAAFRILTAMFPAQADRFEAFMAERGYPTGATTTDPTTAAGVGNAAAAAALAARLADGSNAANGFADTTGYVAVNSGDPDAPNAPGGPDFDPNRWEPLRVPTGTLTDGDGIPTYDNDDPSTYVDQVPLTPHWGEVETFAVVDVADELPPPPPQLGDFSPYTDALGNVTTNDQAYRDQVAEVLEISAGLTPEQKLVAEYWADGPRTESPPGHWNQLAQDIAGRDGHGLADDAKMFFALNNALLDAGVVTWATKYEYDGIRPQSAIRNLYFDQDIEAWGGPNQGTQTILGQEWQPYQDVTFVTPPFPEYTSGHSAFSAAAAEVLAAYSGTDAFYDGVSRSRYDLDGNGEPDLLGEYVSSDLGFENYDGPPITLRWPKLGDAADEAGVSRIFGGIHIASGDLFGREIGHETGTSAFALSQQYFDGAGDDLRMAPAEGAKLVGGPGDDVLVGSSADDVLLGGDDVDVLVGGGGNDRLDGGPGPDQLIGGGGEDAFVLADPGEGVDWLVDFDPSEDFILLAAALFDGALPSTLDGFVAVEPGGLLIDGDGGGDDLVEIAQLPSDVGLDAAAVLDAILIT